jgi:hypothetical protein
LVARSLLSLNISLGCRDISLGFSGYFIALSLNISLGCRDISLGFSGYFIALSLNISLGCPGYFISIFH